MTVADLLNIPSLNKLTLVAGGQGIENSVRTVSVMDAPDIYQWMKGGEFLITTGYSIRDDVDYLCFLIKELHNADVAAFGIKFSRFIGDIPRKLVDTANSLGIPLIYIPDEYAFTDIINPILYAICNQQTYELQQREIVHSRFLNNLVGCSDDSDILATLESFTGIPCAYFDSGSRIQSFSRISREFGNTGLQIAADVPVHTGKCRIFNVSSKNKSYGSLYLCADSPDAVFSSLEKSAIDYAIMLLALNSQSRISQNRIEERYRNEFLSDLISNNIKSEEEIHKRSRLYGWDFTRGAICLVVDINNIKSMYLKDSYTNESGNLTSTVERITRITDSILSDTFGDAKYYKQSDNIIYIISIDAKRAENFEEELRRCFIQIRKELKQSRLNTVTICAGTYKEQITQIHESYQEAHTIVKLASGMHILDSVVFFDHMSAFQLLSSISDQAASSRFVDKYIMPVINYDLQFNTSMEDTLISCIRNGWNDRLTAEELYVHYNSIRYRIGKIEQILGIDLKKHENRFNVELALKLYLIAKGI